MLDDEPPVCAILPDVLSTKRPKSPVNQRSSDRQNVQLMGDEVMRGKYKGYMRQKSSFAVINLSTYISQSTLHENSHESIAAHLQSGKNSTHVTDDAWRSDFSKMDREVFLLAYRISLTTIRYVKIKYVLISTSFSVNPREHFAATFDCYIINVLDSRTMCVEEKLTHKNSSTYLEIRHHDSSCREEQMVGNAKRCMKYYELRRNKLSRFQTRINTIRMKLLIYDIRHIVPVINDAKLLGCFSSTISENITCALEQNLYVRCRNDFLLNQCYGPNTEIQVIQSGVGYYNNNCITAPVLKLSHKDELHDCRVMALKNKVIDPVGRSADFCNLSTRKLNYDYSVLERTSRNLNRLRCYATIRRPKQEIKSKVHNVSVENMKCFADTDTSFILKQQKSNFNITKYNYTIYAAKCRGEVLPPCRCQKRDVNRETAIPVNKSNYFSGHNTIKHIENLKQLRNVKNKLSSIFSCEKMGQEAENSTKESNTNKKLTCNSIRSTILSNKSEQDLHVPLTVFSSNKMYVSGSGLFLPNAFDLSLNVFTKHTTLSRNVRNFISNLSACRCEPIPLKGASETHDIEDESRQEVTQNVCTSREFSARTETECDVSMEPEVQRQSVSRPIEDNDAIFTSTPLSTNWESLCDSNCVSTCQLMTPRHVRANYTSITFNTDQSSVINDDIFVMSHLDDYQESDEYNKSLTISLPSSLKCVNELKRSLTVGSEIGKSHMVSQKEVYLTSKSSSITELRKRRDCSTIANERECRNNYNDKVRRFDTDNFEMKISLLAINNDIWLNSVCSNLPDDSVRSPARCLQLTDVLPIASMANDDRNRAHRAGVFNNNHHDRWNEKSLIPTPVYYKPTRKYPVELLKDNYWSNFEVERRYFVERCIRCGLLIKSYRIPERPRYLDQFRRKCLCCSGKQLYNGPIELCLESKHCWKYANFLPIHYNINGALPKHFQPLAGNAIMHSRSKWFAENEKNKRKRFRKWKKCTRKAYTGTGNADHLFIPTRKVSKTDSHSNERKQFQKEKLTVTVLSKINNQTEVKIIIILAVILCLVPQ